MIWKTPDGKYLVQSKAHPLTYIREVQTRNGNITESYEYYLLDEQGNVLKTFGKSYFYSESDYATISSIHVVINDVLYDYFYEETDRSAGVKEEVKIEELQSLTAIKSFNLKKSIQLIAKLSFRELIEELSGNKTRAIPDFTSSIAAYDQAQADEREAYRKEHRDPWHGPVPAYVHTQDNFKQDEEGRTPLFYAAKAGDKAIVGAIIFRERGTGLFPTRLALLQNKDNQGFKAADVAEQVGHKEIADLLRSEESRMEWSE
jgi:hypothetical protein